MYAVPGREKVTFPIFLLFIVSFMSSSMPAIRTGAGLVVWVACFECLRFAASVTLCPDVLDSAVIDVVAGHAVQSKMMCAMMSFAAFFSPKSIQQCMQMSRATATFTSNVLATQIVDLPGFLSLVDTA